MGRIRELLAHGGIALLALVFALALAGFNLAVAVSSQIVSALQQHTFDEGGGGGGLSFTVFETRIDYGELLLYAIALVLVAGGLYGTWVASRGTTRMCPECDSRVPPEASICRYCTSELVPTANA
ncbi:MAG TPA: hypothetical protein VJM06_03615 [Gaiellaceae bacterium]|nr:hypothetical protein [Gaiellaceae bacterium]